MLEALPPVGTGNLKMLFPAQARLRLRKGDNLTGEGRFEPLLDSAIDAFADADHAGRIGVIEYVSNMAIPACLNCSLNEIVGG